MVGGRKIIWAPTALEDLKSGFDYIAVDSPRRAHAWLEHILKKIEQLNRFSNRGRVIPEIGKSRYRELIVGEYRIFHEIREKETLIFRVFHARRLFNEI